MKPAVPIAAVLFLLSAHSIQAACELNLRYEGGALHWDAVQGADTYTVLEKHGDTLRAFPSRQQSFKVTRRASVPTHLEYTVTAVLNPGTRAAVESNDACTATLEIEIPADPAFRSLTRRAVLPVVGSTPGAFGGTFKTGLTLRPTASDQRGRIIFHPAGRAASDQDPSLRYAFTSSAPLTFDDVVATMGQSGIGSMDIVPDEDSEGILPQIEARLYNDTPIGTFGTFVEPAYPFDYLRADVQNVQIPDARFRVNVGFRTLSDVTMTIFIYNSGGVLLHFFKVSYPAGWMQMTSAADFAGRALAPGQSLQVVFSGSVIPFYTITENATNDPTLIVSPAVAKSRNVGEYID